MNEIFSSDCILVSNSPGELSAWVYPTAEAIKRQAPHTRVIILLVPCFYATGREKDIARTYPDADLVWGPDIFFRIVLRMGIKGYTKAKKGIVVSLGGDPWHARLIGKKLRYPIAAYTMKNIASAKKFSHVFVINQASKRRLIKRGCPEENISVIGDLMRDRVKATLTPEEARKKWEIPPANKVVSLFPGSRLGHVKESMPVYMKMTEELSEKHRDVSFILCLSPFVKTEDIADFIRQRNSYIMDGSWGTIENDVISTAAGAKIIIARDLRYDAIAISDLVITIPGTNTAEIGSIGRAMLTAFTWKVKIPAGGLSFLVNAIPLKGLIRKKVMDYTYRNVKYKSLPNAWADQLISPEIVVDKGTWQITEAADALLRDEEARLAMGKKLQQAMGEPGAAERIAKKIFRIIEETYSK